MPHDSPTLEISLRLPRRGIERLDLLLLSVEALDLNGGEAMVWMSEQMGFTDCFPNRVELWKSRCHNPLRRTTRRGELAAADGDALIRILCALADRLYPVLRGLLSQAEAPEVLVQRWALFQSRLSELVKERHDVIKCADDKGKLVLMRTRNVGVDQNGAYITKQYPVDLGTLDKLIPGFTFSTFEKSGAKSDLPFGSTFSKGGKGGKGRKNCLNLF